MEDETESPNKRPRQIEDEAELSSEEEQSVEESSYEVQSSLEEEQSDIIEDEFDFLMESLGKPVEESLQEVQVSFEEDKPVEESAQKVQVSFEEDKPVEESAQKVQVSFEEKQPDITEDELDFLLESLGKPVEVSPQEVQSSLEEDDSDYSEDQMDFLWETLGKAQAVPQKEQPAEASSSKGKAEGEAELEQVALEKEQTAQVEREDEGETEPEQKVELQTPNASKAELFGGYFQKVMSVVFRDSAVARHPCQEEVEFLSRFCLDEGLPVLPVQRVHSWLGMFPKQLAEGGQGKVFVNEELGLVFKCAATLEIFRSFLVEAKLMSLFGANNGLQRLVGVCPEGMFLVTEYAGRTLDFYLPAGRLSTEQKYIVLRQICTILRHLHQHNFVHNDLKLQNVCLKMTATGPQVTFIDFGLTLLAGTEPRLQIQWDRRFHYAPEICAGEKSGPCGSHSDIYSLGHLLFWLFGGEQMPLLIQRWYAKSQNVQPSERGSLAELEEVMRQQKQCDLRMNM